MNVLNAILENSDFFFNFIDPNPKSCLRKTTNFLIIIGYINVWLLLAVIWFLTKDKK